MLSDAYGLIFFIMCLTLFMQADLMLSLNLNLIILDLLLVLNLEKGMNKFSCLIWIKFRCLDK